MNSPHEIAVESIEREMGTVKVSPWALFLLIFPLILGGAIARSGDIKSTESAIIAVFIVLVFGIALTYFTTQKINLVEDGIRISGLLRTTKYITWEEISHINYSAMLRWVSIRRNGRLVYFNSTDGLNSIHELIIVMAYRTKYRCPKRVRDEVTAILDSIDTTRASNKEC